jgi:hypothetical protein
MTKTRRIAAAALAAAMLSTGTATATATVMHHHRPHLPYWMSRPCYEEGSDNCYWNAKEQGNGYGLSYFVRRLPSDTPGYHIACIFYSKHPHLDYCYRE